MSALTKEERDGLEDVFLSIHSTGKSHLNIKDFYALIITNRISLSVSNLLKRAKIGLKKDKRTQFSSFFVKKKKPLS